MTLEEVGAYILLLTFCWTEGGISQDPKALMRLIRADEKTWARIWPALAPCFTADGEKYVQKRMELVRAAQDEYRGMQSAKGKKSAASRWGVADSVTVRLQPESNRGMIRLQPEGNRGVTALVTERLQPEGNSSSSTSSLAFFIIASKVMVLPSLKTSRVTLLPIFMAPTIRGSCE
jgi:uncharacterized protein YdaU (DUF1376 family)